MSDKISGKIPKSQA